MKKFLFILVLALSLCWVTGCGTPPDETAQASQQSPTRGSVVSVYDEQTNLVGKFSYQNPTENTIDVSQFQKTGYKFEGIYDMNQDIMIFNASGNQSPAIMLDKDFTAVLKYSPLIYQLVFDAVEGELENAAEYTKMISYGEPVGLFPAPVLQGKKFDGWFDEAGNRYSEGTTPVYPKFSEEGYRLSGEIIQLYARYTVQYCDVRLVMQDGTSDIVLQIEYGKMLPDLKEYLKDDGNRAIMGFGVSPNASAAFEDAVYTDLDLYALWREYKYINFVYSDTETKVLKIFREGDMATLPDGVWPGYEFEGWYASALLSGNKLSKVAFTGMSDTYYAKWSVGSYTIQFIADGILVGTVTYSIDNLDVEIPQVPEKASHEGKWEDYTLDYKNKVVNAIYEPKEYQITLMNGLEYSYQNITYGEMYELPVLTRQGYDFIGWYYKDVKLTDTAGKSLQAYDFDDAITMTAGWEPKICTLYFETNGGNMIDPVSVQYGNPYALTQKPQRSGYYFSGWYDESMTNEYIDTITLTGNTVVYAKWVKSVAISTVEGLKKIAENPSGNYHLTADIDLKGGDWAPIGNFTGVLDGNGYKIHNFSLRQSGVNLGFVITNGGTIKNVTFSNVDVSSTLDGGKDVSIGVVCANNAGRLMNVTVEKVSVLVNVSSSNANQVVRIGCLAGENTGLVRVGFVQAELMFKADVRCYGYGDSHSAQMFVGGAVGKDHGTITDVNAKIFVDANEFVYTDCYIGDCYESAYLLIGGISGGEYGTLTDCTANFTCQLSSNAGGDSESRRYTRIGGVVGGCFESSAVTDCSSSGSISFKRVGRHAGSFEMGVGGVVGKVESGSVNNCASTVNITLQEGHGGTTGGIVGLLSVNGKVSNVAYYGTIKNESGSGGYFGGLAGRVSGWLTKGYFHGQIISEKTQNADIVGYIDASGSVSKTIGNGGTGRVFAEGSGSSIYNYLIGTDYEEDALFSRQMLFDDLGLFESDLWSIDEEIGLYLIAFPENELGGV